MGLSPVSTVCHCARATPPNTPQSPSKITALIPTGKTHRVFRRFRPQGTLAHNRSRNATPPEPHLPGPFAAAGCPTTLAAYPSWRVRAGASVRVRTRTGRIMPSRHPETAAPFKTEPTVPAAHTPSRSLGTSGSQFKCRCRVIIQNATQHSH